ncbi:MAG TPA: glutaredoxin family protein [Acidimicrobiia bacterium]|jgi:hypothetical protein
MFRRSKPTLPAGLTLVTRRACGLCEEALGAIGRVGVAGPVAIVDIAEHAEHAMFDERLPVLLDSASNVLAEGRITERQLRAIARSLV